MSSQRPCLTIAVVWAFWALLAIIVGPLAEETPPAAATKDEPRREATLPPARETRYEIFAGERQLAFAATAGAIVLDDDEGEPEAEIAYVAYRLEGAEPVDRPVTFAINGGPGAASAYLHLGVLGPWRLPLDEETIIPSQSVELVANPETWLTFPDLVFVDPVGTGFSRLVDDSDRVRDRYLSVEGDIDALAAFIRRWLVDNGRLRSPKYFIGESYGGFRGPRLAETLQTEAGIALAGMTLLSPVLDFGWRDGGEQAPVPMVAVLPSLAAARMEAAGTISPAVLRDVEAYATGAYVTDLLRGLKDEAAVARIIERVSALTGLDRRIVERFDGRVDRFSFTRELLRDQGLLVSPYDTAVAGTDPTPERPLSNAADPVLDGLTAPLTTAMLAYYQDVLDWLPEGRYRLLNDDVNRSWDWGDGWTPPSAVDALRNVLALDPAFRVLVAHGYTDLVTPYFESTLILRQLRDFGPGERLRQATYRGGHMFYTREESRRAFRDDARWLYGLDAG
jgi:carboxypeptidase C (cathepsin A)